MSGPQPAHNWRESRAGPFPCVSCLKRLKRARARAIHSATDPADLELLRSAAVPDAVRFDPLRDGPLRYCGYANECGEAFAAWLPPYGVPLSYAIAIFYVLVDTADKTLRGYIDAQDSLKQPPSSPLEGVDVARLVTLLTAERAVDTLVWQMLASVVCPGATIHVIVLAVSTVLDGGLHLHDMHAAAPSLARAVASAAAVVHAPPEQVADVLSRSIPTAAGLAAIPFIVHPIDSSVHWLLGKTLRPIANTAICEGAHGKEAGLDCCVEPFRERGEKSSS